MLNDVRQKVFKTRVVFHMLYLRYEGSNLLAQIIHYLKTVKLLK